MNDAIGGILPLALAIALSPPPIIAIVLLLLSPSAKVSSLGFLLGWIIGVLVPITAFTLLSSALPERDPEVARPLLGSIQLALGALVLLLAVRSVRSRPRAGETPQPAKWMSAITSVTPARSIPFGFAFAAANPKNLLISLSAGLVIAAEYLDAGSTAIVIAVYCLIAASSVLLPVVAYLLASDRMAKPLEALEKWLVGNSWAIMAILLLVIGTLVIGNGIENF